MAADQDTAAPRRAAERRALLLRRLAAARPPAAGVRAAGGTSDEPAPMSPAQEGLWFIDQFSGASPLYAVPMAFRLRGRLDVPALTRALDAVVARHEMLRATVVDVDGEPRLRIAPELRLGPALEDLSGLPAPEREGRLADRLAAESARVFDLATGPLVVAALLRLTPAEHVLVLCVHHIVFDGWSLGVLFRDLGELYAAAVDGQPPRLPQLGSGFVDWVTRQRALTAGPQGQRQRDYWHRTLAALPPLDLPTDRPRPPVAGVSGAAHRFTLPAGLRPRLRELCREAQVTEFTALLAGFQALLGLRCGQRDVAVGIPMANRPTAAVQALVGYFVNTAVARTDLDGDPTFRGLLDRVRDVLLGAHDNSDYPVSALVAELAPDRDPSRPPLFQVMFLLHQDEWQRTGWPGLEVESLDLPMHTSMFELSLVVAPDGDELGCEFSYRTELFDDSTLAGLAADYGRILERAVAAPGTRLSALLDPPARAAGPDLAGWIDGEEFSCLGAKASLRRGELVRVDLGEMGRPGTTAELYAAVERFVRRRLRPEEDFASLVAVFDGPRQLAEEPFERLLWAQLAALHELDSHPWAADVSADPASPVFSFSLAGHPFFVVGLHERASRISRRFSRPAMAFNSHRQFERLRHSGAYPGLLTRTRERELRLQGSVNPALADHGTVSEARQYAGRAVPPDWTCPFRAAR